MDQEIMFDLKLVSFVEILCIVCQALCKIFEDSEFQVPR